MKEGLKKIPSKIVIGGQEIDVKEEVKIENNLLGQCSVAEGWIKIANTYDDRIQTESCKRNTYYHELTHAILDTMGETKLSQNEKFVNCFASFLTEAMQNAYFMEEIAEDDNKQNTDNI